MAKKASRPARTGSRKAFCVGINDYPYDGSDLNGCVNDATAWATLLTDHYGFRKPDVKVIVDDQATKRQILAGLKWLLASAKAGDVLVFANSSHGSYIADRDNDEEKYDEILCPHDIADNHIVDDDLRQLISNLPDGVHMTVILDNCFSGTATRAPVNEIIPGLRTPDDRRVRFLSPALRGLQVLENPWTAKPQSRIAFPQSKMKEILLSGCTDREYSYDAFLGGVYHGAMTYYALESIRRANYKLTYAQLHQRVCSLIKDYPQNPQLEGNRTNKRRQIFG